MDNSNRPYKERDSVFIEGRGLLDVLLYIIFNYTFLFQLMINLESYGRYAGIALTCLGGILFITGITLTLTKRWKRSDNDDEDMLTN